MCDGREQAARRWLIVLVTLSALLTPVLVRAEDEISFFGDARARYDGRDRSDGPYRARGRTRIRAGWTIKQLDGRLDWRVRVATETHDPVSRNLTVFGRTGGEHDTVGLDTLQLNYRPWDTLTLSAGKVPLQSLWSASEILFDGDLTAPGVAAQWKPAGPLGWFEKPSVTAGAYFVNAMFGATSDPYLVAGQVRGNLGPVTLTTGLYHFAGLQAINFRSSEFTQFTNGFANLDLDGDTVAETRRIVDPSITTWRVRLDYPFRLFGKPVRGGVEYVLNTAASTQKAGYEVRLDCPELPFGEGYALWRDVGQNAVFSSWADSDLGEGTGFHSGLEIGYGAPIFDWLTLELSYFHFDRHQPLTATGGRDTDRLYVDLIAKWSL